MITLPNGHKIDFLCSSGALGFYGDGWWWEQPFRWLNLLKPQELTIITKTLTVNPRKGNHSFWFPFRSVRFINNGVVNAMGLPNPGFENWINNYKPKYKLIVSIAPKNVEEADFMAKNLGFLAIDANKNKGIIAIEYNLSCPTFQYSNSLQIIDALKKYNLPVILKLGYEDCKNWNGELEGKADVLDIINSVRWSTIYPNKRSPLKKFGGGGVSGTVIKNHAKEAINLVASFTKTPIISGGGIDSAHEVYVRRNMGAKAFTFGSVFMRKPWLPNKIANECRQKFNRSN